MAKNYNEGVARNGDAKLASEKLTVSQLTQAVRHLKAELEEQQERLDWLAQLGEPGCCGACTHRSAKGDGKIEATLKEVEWATFECLENRDVLKRQGARLARVEMLVQDIRRKLKQRGDGYVTNQND